jgi:ABC-type phosphate transport system substrate-binding protein
MRLISRFAATAVLIAVASPAVAQDLTGAGATFPYPIYSKWFSDYASKTNVKINYQSIGSGGGIRQLSEQTVDFGATDAPMSDAELAKAKKLLDFVKWALTDGEKSAATLDYAPLPPAMAKQLLKRLGTVTVASR